MIKTKYVAGHSAYGTSLKGYYCQKCMRYFGKNEDLAERCCATDRKCDDCGGLTGSKDISRCRGCQTLRRRKRWESFEEHEWNGEPVTDYLCDWFGFDEEEIEEYVAENPDCCLVLAEPYRPRQIDLLDVLCDFLPDDLEGPDVPKKVQDGLDVVNKWLRETVFSYVPSQKRVVIK